MNVKLYSVGIWVYIQADFHLIQQKLKQFFACQYDKDKHSFRFRIDYLQYFYETYKKYNIIIDTSLEDTFKQFIEFKQQSENYKNFMITGYRQFCSAEYKLEDIQKQGALWLTFIQKGILSFGTGVGKTFTSLEAAHILHSQDKNIKKILIITLNSITKQWENEINKAFPTLKVFNVCNIKDSKKRTDLYNNYNLCDDFSCLVLNYEKVRIDLEYLTKINYNIIIIDEASKLKSLGRRTASGNLNNRFSIKELCDKTKYVFALTATPIETSYYNLFGIFQTINDSIFSGGLTRFKEHYFRENVFHQWIDFRSEKLSELKNIVSPYIFFKEIDLKVNAYIHKIRLKFNEYDYNKYNEIEKNKINEYMELHPYTGDVSDIEELKDYEYLVKSECAFQSVNNKFQFCDFPSIVFETEYDSLYSPKINWILNNKHLFKNKTIIFDSRTKTTTKICEAFELNNIKYHLITGDIPQNKRNDIIERFKKDDVNFCICSDCLGYGANLQFCANMIHFNLDFTGSQMKQRTGRIIRRGQKQKVNIYLLIMENTIEEKIFSKINKRIQNADDILTLNISKRDLMEFIKN